MKQTHLFPVAAAVLFLFAADAFSQTQSRSILVPAAPAESASAASSSASQPRGTPPAPVAQQKPDPVGSSSPAAAKVSAAIAAARDQASPPASPSQSGPASPRPPAPPATSPSGSAAPAAVSPVSLPAASPPTAPTVQRRADGSQVFRTPVTPSMIQEEQRIAALNEPPAVPSGRRQASSSPAPHASPPAAPQSALASFLGTTNEGLPKWATEGVTRTNGKTRLVVSQGVTEMVTIARNFPNRFITPFESAEVVTTDENISHDGVGGAVVLSTASDKPIGIFIQDRFSDRSIGLVLMPEDIPQRELRLVLDESWVAPVLRPNPEASQAQLPVAQTDFVDFLKATLRSMAKGEVPDGHALTPLDPELVPRCQVPGLALRPAQMLEGPTTRVAVYVANNPTSVSVPFQEAGCYRKGVLAVSAFPRPVLQPGESTEVYVVLRKDVTTQTITGKRRPVLVSH